MHSLPGPSQHPVRQLVAMARNPYAFLDQNQARYGDLFVLRLPGMPPLHICADPKAVATLTASSYDDCERFGGGA
ncbi:MAG TPA: hypothetical protein PKI03_22815, partial [Pseudomonadota bacterium]|nr:hypothetical protein [Pseudomonadota bacterium]